MTAYRWRQHPTTDHFHHLCGEYLTPIGEEGDLLLLGHVAPLRAIAAANRFARQVEGVLNLVDDLSATVADVIDTVSHDWAVFVGECGRCGPSYACDQCLTARAGGWWLAWGVGETEYPITVIERS